MKNILSVVVWIVILVFCYTVWFYWANTMGITDWQALQLYFGLLGINIISKVLQEVLK